jgi:hypothetical protein
MTRIFLGSNDKTGRTKHGSKVYGRRKARPLSGGRQLGELLRFFVSISASWYNPTHHAFDVPVREVARIGGSGEHLHRRNTIQRSA